MSPPIQDNSVCAAPASDANRWFVEEVYPHESMLKAYVRHTYPAIADVDDVVQESFLRIWKARLAHPITFARAFLLQTARRAAIDRLRRDRRSPLVSVKDMDGLFVMDGEPTASGAAENAEAIDLFVKAIDSLPGRCREIFILCQVEGIPQREVAARLGISENTVGVQAARGLQRCEAYVRRRLKQP